MFRSPRPAHLMLLLLSASPAMSLGVITDARATAAASEDLEYGAPADEDPVVFERTATVHVDVDPQRVLAYFEPAARRAWSHADSRRDAIFHGRHGRLDGTVFYDVERDQESWVIVGDHSPKRGLHRRVYVIPEIELLVEEVRVAPGAHGGAELTVDWDCVGLSDRGNDAVSRFFEGTEFESMVGSWAASIEKMASQVPSPQGPLQELAKAPPFKPVRHERSATLNIRSKASVVFEKLLPRERDAWAGIALHGTPLFEGREVNDPGAAFLFRDSGHGTIWSVLLTSDADEGFIRYLRFMPEVEMWVEELRVEQDGDGTRLTSTWKVAGISEESNEGVDSFFAGDHFAQQMKMVEGVLNRAPASSGHESSPSVERAEHGAQAEEQHAQPQDHAATQDPVFEPVCFEHRGSFRIQAKPDTVFRLLSHRQRRLWASIYAENSVLLQSLFPYEGNSSEGAMSYREASDHTSWLFPAKYDVATRTARDVLYFPNQEIIFTDWSCLEDGHGGTRVEVFSRIVGTTPTGNKAVSVANGHGSFNEQMMRMEDELSAFLAGKSGHEIQSLLSAGPAQAPEPTFVPYTFRKERSVRIDADLDRVFAAASKPGSNAKAQPNIVTGKAFSGLDGMLTGGMSWKIYPGHGHSSPAWTVILDHDAERGRLCSLTLIPGVELMVSNLEFSNHPYGGTLLRRHWMVAGPTKDGNDAIESFWINNPDDFNQAIDTYAEQLLAATQAEVRETSHERPQRSHGE